MPPSHLLIVRQPERGTTLQDFLARRLGVSRNQAKRLLDDRGVFVNRRRVWMARHELRTGDEVEVPPPAAVESRAAARPRPLRVLLEEDDYLVVDKPAGILSTGADSVEERLRSIHPEILTVHRLDRDTTGCLLFARTPEMQAALEKEFEERRVEKTYLAIAIGLFPPHLTRVERPIGGLTALTEFKVLRRNPTASYIEAKPRTGRTHQIRAHLQYAGFPLAGDRAYLSRAVEDDWLRHAPRQMLHAWRLNWKHPVTGAIKRVQAPLPQDFRHALVALRLAPRPKRGGGR